MSHRKHLWTSAVFIAACTLGFTTHVGAVEPAPPPSCDDTCMSEVEAFCAIPELASYDLVGDCVGDITSSSVPATLAPSPAPYPVMSDGEQESIELDL